MEPLNNSIIYLRSNFYLQHALGKLFFYCSLSMRIYRRINSKNGVAVNKITVFAIGNSMLHADLLKDLLKALLQ